ncbi:hypothetical protein [Synoicihabitans lomoniglobus]|uniref:Uncharacterized protein n=1 Tax=Synoicihabitans lomoniglobus TaxID=2909285 RepID=A0AAF0I1Z5_9BACT|nr:hypothetical protein [Opitutaceae bacterium LMO-M01]WED66147.1 hypothetical protein PXH66_04720 [Opitutaceae bacterium LMO-M01]
MIINHFDLPKPNRVTAAAGFGASAVNLGADDAAKLTALRRRRTILEAYFAPFKSPAALPSAVDRLVLWRSRHGRHRD